MQVAPADHSQWFVDNVLPCGGQLRAYLFDSFPSVRDVDDVVQESYLRVWKASATRPVQHTKAFLFKVAKHIALDSVFRENSMLVTPVGNLDALSLVEHERGVIDSVRANENARMVADGITSLPPRCREIVMLRKIKNLSRKEVADRLCICEKTVDEQVSRGMKRLDVYFRHRGVRSRDGL